MNEPELRFPEFSGEWERKKLDDIAKFSKGKNISKNDISDDGIPCIRYGELYTIYKEKISEVFSKTNLNPMELIFSEENDIIIPTSGETAIDLAKASCIMNSDVAIGGDTTIIKTDGDGLFFSYYLNSKRKHIAKLAQGVSVVHLYPNHLKSTGISVPKIEEQEKISYFLSIIDEKIGFIEKKRELWEIYKKGLIQQIYSQKLRFKDENVEDYPNWEERNLGEIVTLMQSGLSRKLEGKDIGLPVLRSNNLIGNKLNLSDIRYWYDVDDKGANLENYYLEKGDLLVNFINSFTQIGKTALYNGELKRNAIFTTNIMRLTFNSNTDTFFIHYYFQTRKYLDYVQSITKPAVNQASFTTVDFKRFKLNLPCLQEQIKIANFLLSIDEKLDVINKELEINKEFKKGLLQQMFC